MLLFYTTFGWTVSLFQTGRVEGLELTTASVALTPLGARVRSFGPPLFYAVAVVVLLMNITRMKERRAGQLVPPLLAGVALIIALMMSTGSLTAGLSHVVLVVTIALATWSIGLKSSDLVVLGRIGVGIAFISLLMALTTANAWTDQQEDSKAIIGDAVLAGFFPQMNPLGMSMAITLPFTLLFKRMSYRILGFSAITLTLLLASSRTALIAAGVGLLAGLVIRMVPNSVKRVVAVVGFTLTASFWLIVPLQSDSSAFTDRGRVWRGSLALIPDRPIWGYGPHVFGLNGEVARTVGGVFWHGHNVFLTFVLIGGVIAFVALMLFLLPPLFAGIRAAQQGTVLPLIAVFTIVAIGIAEVPIRPTEFDGVAWVSWIALFAISTMSVSGPVQADVNEGESSHRRGQGPLVVSGRPHAKAAMNSGRRLAS